MQAIAETGATWYVDDFGMGFSSISHLRDLPVRGLKLDRSFTAGIRNGDRTCIKLAQGLIGLADGLGLDTVAEGIETEFEAGALLGQGWHFGQGWLFGRAAPREELLS
jgi:sensor c-di-GMP phosphodiesterase-like protein